MFVGFDYGSANCAIGVWQNNRAELVPLEQDNCYLPSSLYALHPSLIVHQVNQGLQCKDLRADFQRTRAPLLNSLAFAKSEFDLQDDECVVHIGRDAVEQYIANPEEGHYIKSPKSFFGAVGLKPSQLDFFEDIATVMIMALKQRAEAHLGQSLTSTVIGRPVNFQAIGAEQSNQQALTILSNAAKKAGFIDVEFLYEPLAAGIDFETTLTENKKVLVIDIGGGTTDCSFVQMGPDFRDKTDRQADFLAHSGKRIGGNDLDISLAYHGLMPLFGAKTALKSGLEIPNQPFWQACKINDVILQSEFYSEKNLRHLQQIFKEVKQPDLFNRLINLQQNKQGHQLVRAAELAKIALSSTAETRVELNDFEKNLVQQLNQAQLAQAIAGSISQVVSLAQDAISEAATVPDIIYLTGGSAQSPLLKQALQLALGDIPMLNGDHFGSVTAGLTKRAMQLFS
ncbi:molecular chaperone [Pseudoalteromonas tunicata]|uniref:molecular chaperone n=1 Tax=Pseudoalteromonas tunicata TaxID=314281 RepID=UPI00273FC81F|nr:molecular chaperone [Pseudoalteromonas tunicata]MDP5212880.1 molecular chaperone [Pseudoalteromonas tunicata]